MPATKLWITSSLGKVFTLSTQEQSWREVPYCGVELKRLSATQWCVWGIGSDHQVYVFIPRSDVPIRCWETTYENQRWNPYGGFSSNLLPTDRPPWSSKDGLKSLPKESFKLASDSWQWEGEWHVEENLDGQPLGTEGWTYAIDFPRQYYPEKRWNSLVRRKKWIRCRRYATVDKWVQVPSVHEDPTEEPFIDIAVGGSEIPGGDPDAVTVWAVTVMGRVMFRYGVRTIRPEGQGWIHVTTPAGYEVSQISVGPMGLVWIVLGDGATLVRTGVTRENARGGKLLFQIWFRKGVNSQRAGIEPTSATGTGWVEMVGQMAVVSVGPDDQFFFQVWGLGCDDKLPYFRTGVTYAELSGKTWKPINLPLYNQLSRGSSRSSLVSQQSLQHSYEYDTVSGCSDKQDDPHARNQHSNYSDKTTSTNEKPHVKTNMPFQASLSFISESNPSDDSLSQTDSGVSITNAKIIPSPLCLTPVAKTLRKASESRLFCEDSSSSDVSDTVVNFIQDASDDEDEENSDDNECAATNTTEEKRADFKTIKEKPEGTRESGQEIEHKLLQMSIERRDDASSELEISSIDNDHENSSVGKWVKNSIEDYFCDYLNMEVDMSWVWLSGSGCVVDHQSPPPWFDQAINVQDSNMNELWRKEILSQFLKRYKEQVSEFTAYPHAVEK
ncbi:tectonin beta-propeller repeat-containing protein-like, partial [Limulus polyphemus]|uniref:Tectonin beta-propeller repeat-containing protein-like n=1 Tax=Limulus polyphemus TaxID=6850 RepID=A0ABM1RUQ2_LIMPO